MKNISLPLSLKKITTAVVIFLSVISVAKAQTYEVLSLTNKGKMELKIDDQRIIELKKLLTVSINIDKKPTVVTLQDWKTIRDTLSIQKFTTSYLPQALGNTGGSYEEINTVRILFFEMIQEDNFLYYLSIPVLFKLINKAQFTETDITMLKNSINDSKLSKDEHYILKNSLFQYIKYNEVRKIVNRLIQKKLEK